MIPRLDRCFQHEAVSRRDSECLVTSNPFETSGSSNRKGQTQRISIPVLHEAPTNRPHPGRRRHSSQEPFRNARLTSASFISRSRVLLILCLILILCDSVTALDARSRTLGDRSELRRLARRGEILVDRSEPPTPQMRQRRQDTSPSDLPSAILPSSLTPTSTLGGSSETNSPSRTTASKTSTFATASPTSTQSPLPSPFDGSLGNNFTSPSCPAFFQNFLSNTSFSQCLPFSLLLQTSNSFFAVERSLVRLTQTLDATCNVNFNECNTLMSNLATQLTSNANCGADYQAQNPNVMQAYDGFVSYATLYSAGCTKDSDGNYCKSFRTFI